MEHCPFCAESIVHVCELSYDQGYAAFCLGCTATGPQKDTADEAMIAWCEREKYDETKKRTIMC